MPANADVPADRCWVDARVSCPYGSPEGQYILRPRSFCDRRCHHFADNCDDDLYTDFEVSIMAGEELIGHFNEHHVALSSQLEATADVFEAQKDPDKALVLRQAADIIEKSKQNVDILLREDLPP